VFEIVERKRHGLLKCSSNSFHTKRHIPISERTPWTDGSGFLLVFRIDLYLIVSRKTIHERKGFTTCALIDLIQVDIGGHPPFPNGSKQFSGHFGNLLFLAGFNFRGHFEGLNEGFFEI
jgi:hypothetical protein